MCTLGAGVIVASGGVQAVIAMVEEQSSLFCQMPDTATDARVVVHCCTEQWWEAQKPDNRFYQRSNKKGCKCYEAQLISKQSDIRCDECRVGIMQSVCICVIGVGLAVRQISHMTAGRILMTILGAFTTR